MRQYYVIEHIGMGLKSLLRINGNKREVFISFRDSGFWRDDGTSELIKPDSVKFYEDLLALAEEESFEAVWLSL